MHRPGIARVAGDKVILDRTTVEEVKRCHRDTLILAVEVANEGVRRFEQSCRLAEEQAQKKREEHEAQVQRMASEITFD